MDSARHVIGFHLTQDTWELIAFDHVAGTIQQSLASRLMDSARRVIGCRLTQGRRVYYEFDDVASNVQQSLACGAPREVYAQEGCGQARQQKEVSARGGVAASRGATDGGAASGFVTAGGAALMVAGRPMGA